MQSRKRRSHNDGIKIVRTKARPYSNLSIPEKLEYLCKKHSLEWEEVYSDNITFACYREDSDKNLIVVNSQEELVEWLEKR